LASSSPSYQPRHFLERLSQSVKISTSSSSKHSSIPIYRRPVVTAADCQVVEIKVLLGEALLRLLSIIVSDLIIIFLHRRGTRMMYYDTTIN